MLKFFLWAVGAYVVLVLVNMTLPILVGFLAQSKWHTKAEEAELKSQAVGSVLAQQTFMVVAFGFVAGVVVALVLFLVTLSYVSTHWVYQLFLIVGFFSASQHAQRLYLIKSKAGSGVFGRTGDKFAGIMFGGYFWGTILSVIGVNVGRWFA